MLTVGMFALEEVAGTGGMGEVWRARDGLAVKVLTVGRARDPRALVDFEREARATASLDSAWIVRVHEYGRIAPEEADRSEGRLASGSPYLVMDWMAGGTARALCGAAPWPRVRDALRAVLKGLAHAHARGLLHLDVKPGNVLLDGDGRVRLADFGVSRAIGEAGPVAGTPSYMAPEQRSGEALGPWADLYAVGRLAQALVGEGDVPAGFWDWVDALTAGRREERFPCAPDALAGLDALGRPIPTARSAVEVSLDEATLAAPPMSVSDGLPRNPPIRIRAPLPVAWEEEEAPASRPGLGLGLFGLREAPLVGREALRSALWASVRRDRGAHLVALVGHPGAGKTRLARALADHVRETSPATVLWCAHGDLEGALLAQLRATARGPVLLVIDDAPRSGSALDVVRAALDAPSGAAPLTIVLTIREDEREVEGLPALLSRAEVLEVPALTADEEATLLRAMLGIAPDLATRIRERTAGNPLFTLQTIGDWVARGLFAPGPDGLVLTVDEPPVAEAIGATWARRVAAVAERAGRPGVVEAFEIAAVLGGPIATSEWEAAISPGADGPATLDAAFRAGLFVRSEGGGWDLVHGLLADTLLRQAEAEGRLAAHHRRCAVAVTGADWRSQARIGRHKLRGGLVVEARGPLKAAATEALRRGLPRDAAAITEDLAEAAEGAGDAWQAEVALLRARSARGLRRPARAHAERIVSIATSSGDLRLLAEGTLMLGLVCDDEGAIDAEIEAFREARRLFLEVGDPEGVARADLRLGWGLMRLRREVEAAGCFEQAAAAFAAAGEGFSEAMALNGWGEAVMYTDLGMARHLFARAYAHHRASGHIAGAVDVLVNLGNVEVQAEDLDAAERRFREALDLGRKGQISPFFAAMNLAEICSLRGRPAEAASALIDLRESVRHDPIRELMILTTLLPNVVDAPEEQWRALVADTTARLAQTGLKSPVAAGMLERAAQAAPADRAGQLQVLRAAISP